MSEYFEFFKDFFKSIDWSPLERHETMFFRAPHTSGWEVFMSQGEYIALPRTRFETPPHFVAKTVEDMGRWLFKQRAYIDEE